MLNNDKLDKVMIELFNSNDFIMNMSSNRFIKKWMNKVDRGSKVLDCGCGMGHFIVNLKRNGFKDVSGIEVCKEMADIALKNTDCRIINADIMLLSKYFENESQDVIVFSDVLHHINDINKQNDLLIKCQNILKKNGIIFIREPFPTIMTKIIRFMSKLGIFYIGPLKGRLKAYSEEHDLLEYFFSNWAINYSDMLARSGFRIISDIKGPMRLLLVIEKI